MDTIKETNFKFPGQTNFYRGKVRDVYTINDRHLVMVATDRISAFDVVLPKPIPYKGQVLNEIAAGFLKVTEDIVPNWVITIPDPNVAIGRICKPFKVEMVIRGYLAGHAWREYYAGKRSICGINLPDGLKENDRLLEPIITPTTKAAVGHDEDISRADILSKGIVAEEDYLELEKYTKELFKRGTEIADERGLILVDTKYEFGKASGKIFLIDEIHTPDSSRYFYREGYTERQEKGETQKQLSKEFVRKWLLDNHFSGQEGQLIPEMTSEIVQSISNRYIELYEYIAGERFKKYNETDITSRIEKNIVDALGLLL